MTRIQFILGLLSAPFAWLTRRKAAMPAQPKQIALFAPGSTSRETRDNYSHGMRRMNGDRTIRLFESDYDKIRSIATGLLGDDSPLIIGRYGEPRLFGYKVEFIPNVPHEGLHKIPKFGVFRDCHGRSLTVCIWAKILIPEEGTVREAVSIWRILDGAPPGKQWIIGHSNSDATYYGDLAGSNVLDLVTAHMTSGDSLWCREHVDDVRVARWEYSDGGLSRYLIWRQITEVEFTT